MNQTVYQSVKTIFLFWQFDKYNSFYAQTHNINTLIGILSFGVYISDILYSIYLLAQIFFG